MPSRPPRPPSSARSWTAAVLVLGLLTTGCLSSPTPRAAPSDAATSSVPPPASTAVADDATCAMAGQVLDETGLPIVNARVELQDTGESTRSDAEGKFAFSFLAPGNHQLLVSALGYQSQTKRLLCSAGEHVEDLDFTLKEIPKPLVPHRSTFTKQGRFGCIIAIVISSGDVCKTAGQAPNAVSTFSFIADGNQKITSAVYELQWDRNVNFGANWLRLVYPAMDNKAPRTYCPNSNPTGTGGDRFEGTSRACVQVVAINATAPLAEIDEDGQTYHFYVSVVGTIGVNTTTYQLDNRASVLVVDQPFTIGVTWFYNNDPIPEGYSAFSS